MGGSNSTIQNSAEKLQIVESAIKHHYDRCNKPTEKKMDECHITFAACERYAIIQTNENELVCDNVMHSLKEFQWMSDYYTKFYDVQNKDPENLKFVANAEFYEFESHL